MDIEKKLAKLQDIEGYQNYFALTSKGQCILCNNFNYSSVEAQEVLMKFVTLKKGLKKHNVIPNLQGLTIYRKESNIITFFTGKPGQRVLVSLFLNKSADINRAKFKVYSLFEIE